MICSVRAQCRSSTSARTCSHAGLGVALEVGAGGAPSSTPSASGAPLLQPLRPGPHLCQLELQPVPLRLLRRAKPRALGVALLQALRRLG